MNTPQVKSLIERILRLHAEEEELRADRMREAFGLTKSEAALVEQMMDGEAASRQDLLDALLVRDGRFFRDPNVVRVFVCNARRKLAPFGICIHRGSRRQGPWIDAESIQRLREAA